MKHIISGLIAVCVLTLIVVHATRADTDYQCLHSCMGNNRGEMACMKQCSYNMPGQVNSTGNMVPVSTAAPQGHRVFSSLTPQDPSKVVVKKKEVSPYVAQIDHTCMAQCLQTKMEYENCANSCTNLSAAQNGSTLVKAGSPQTLPLQMNNYNLQAQPRAN